MNNRDKWTVRYLGSELARAAKDKDAFHAGRAKWWAEKREEVIAKIRSEGLTVTDSIVDELAKTGYSNTMSVRGGPTVEIDAALQEHLVEAQTKMQTHKHLCREYDGWAQMLAAHKEEWFETTVEDWLYFFGK